MEKRVLVIGELNIDMIVSGLPVLPALGHEFLASGLHVVLGSSSAICAAGLARLGTKVDFLGKVGVDYYGDFVLDQLRLLNVGTRHILRDSVIRTGVTISLTYPEDRAMITYPGCIPLLSLAEINTSVLRSYSHLHVGSYFLQRGLQPDLPELFRQARRAGLTTSLDSGYDPEERWGGDDLLMALGAADMFIPNETEARAISGVDDTEGALRELCEHVKLAVVKCGPGGAMSLEDGQVIRSPGFKVEVRDTTGAGDSFNAGFLHAYVIQGLPLEEALRFANACGALSTTGFGGTAAQPTLEQARTFLKVAGAAG